jgi:GNAT superfamily N-acetyltransferase
VIVVRRARACELQRIQAFYRSTGYGGGVSPEDRVFVAEHASALLGAVRLVREHGVTVLRGMRVAEDSRRRGVGTQLLAAVRDALADEECFCLPYRHLIAFYGQIGFACSEPSAGPPFLAQRLAQHHARSAGDFVLMRRPAGALVRR